MSNFLHSRMLSFIKFLKIYRIIELAELEGTHQHHQVQLSSLCGTMQESHHVPEAVVQTPLGAMAASLGGLFQCPAPLDEESYPSIHPKLPWISFALLPQVLSFLDKCFLNNWISRALCLAALNVEVGHHHMLIPFLIISVKQPLYILSMSPDPASIEHMPSFFTLYSRGHPCSAKLSFCLICLTCDIGNYVLQCP